MYSAAAKNKYKELVKVAMMKLASTYGVILQQETSREEPKKGATNEASPKR